MIVLMDCDVADKIVDFEIVDARSVRQRLCLQDGRLGGGEVARIDEFFRGGQELADVWTDFRFGRRCRLFGSLGYEWKKSDGGAARADETRHQSGANETGLHEYPHLAETRALARPLAWRILLEFATLVWRREVSNAASRRYC